MNKFYKNFPTTYTIERCREIFPLGAELIIFENQINHPIEKARIAGYYYDYNSMMWRPAVRVMEVEWVNLEDWIGNKNFSFEVDCSNIKIPFGGY